MRWFQLSRTHNAGVLGTATPGVLRAFPHLSSPEVPSLRRRYPASPVVRTSPPPCPARPAPYGVPAGACTPLPGLPVLLRLPSPIHADTTTPAGPARCLCRFSSRPVVGLPLISGGSAPASPFSRPARCSRMFRPAWLLNCSSQPFDTGVLQSMLLPP